MLVFPFREACPPPGPCRASCRAACPTGGVEDEEGESGSFRNNSFGSMVLAMARSSTSASASCAVNAASTSAFMSVARTRSAVPTAVSAGVFKAWVGLLPLILPLATSPPLSPSTLCLLPSSSSPPPPLPPPPLLLLLLLLLLLWLLLPTTTPSVLRCLEFIQQRLRRFMWSRRRRRRHIRFLRGIFSSQSYRHFHFRSLCHRRCRNH
mmetsp:Transcript_50309/g.101214  ORF Transcript_50309/g.101214 Transcript_50309/m.101214 type:complete len:208 (+) Transcript_50309:223-846(+)